MSIAGQIIEKVTDSIDVLCEKRKKLSFWLR